jgi:hypothetical protein
MFEVTLLQNSEQLRLQLERISPTSSSKSVLPVAA